MQRPRSYVGSATCESAVDPQRYWNSMRDPSEEQLSDCVILSSNANITYQNSTSHEDYGSSGWNLGESSLSGERNLVNLNDSYRNSSSHERIGLNGWILGDSSSSGSQNQVSQNAVTSECARATRLFAERRYLSSESPSLENINVNQHVGQAVSERLFIQSSIPQNLPNIEFTERDNDDDEDDDCQIIECVDTLRPGTSFQQCIGTSSSSHPVGIPSGCGGFIVEDTDEEDTDERPIISSDNRRLSCKRKTLESSTGQPSQSGSSSFSHHFDNSSWQGMSLHHNTNSPVPVPAENILNANLSDQYDPRIGLGVGRPVSDIPLGLSSSGSAEGSHRNLRLRINNSHQQDCSPHAISSTQDHRGNANVISDQRMLRLPPISSSLDSGPLSMDENGSSHRRRPSIATLRRISQSRYHRASSSETESSSSAISGAGAAMHEEHNSGSIPTDISQHPMFIPAPEIANSYQTTGTWDLAGVSGEGSPSGVGSGSGVNSAATSNHGHHRLHSRSAALLLERHLASSSAIPYPSRSLAAFGEGRSRLVSEIRNVLDLMRRGEGLRAEDVMILDQSVLLGMADFHDRHRDMRLDVDNMSYEELLALGERIGNVSTGLSEETISSRLKQRQYKGKNTEEDVEGSEPCCVCQEEYKGGEDLSILECGHEFHAECIKQWLMKKNSCPICKTTGLSK